MGKLQGKSSADIISYCADGMCDMDKIYIVWNSFSSPLYNATLHDSRITYCDENFINSTSFVDILNCFVNEANISTVEEIQEIKLTNWKLGIDGHPVFATQ